MRSKKVASIPVEGVPNRFIEVSVFYQGKPSYVGARPQGYHLSVQPYTDECNGFVSFKGYSGFYATLERATRFSAKKLDNLAETVMDTDLCKEMIAKVLANEAAKVAATA